MNSKTKIVITVGLGLLLSVAAVMFGFQPLLADVKQLNETLGLKQNELTKIEKQIVEFKSAQTDLARATFKDDVYSTVVIREDLSLAIQDLEAAAGKTDTAETIQITEPVQETGRRGARATETVSVFEGLTLSEEIRYTMTARNDYEGFVSFLQYLENLPHFTEFDQIKLNAVTDNSSGDEDSRNTGDITGTLEGVFLVKKNGQNKE
jgi:hypothetical protein